MRVVRYSALVLGLVCCNLAMAQAQVDIDADVNRGERVEERRDLIGENRDQRQDNRQDRRANREGVAERIGESIENNTASNNANLDQFIATCLLIGNQEEVALAQEAVDRAENEQVKQFAQMLVDDHQNAIQKLQQHANQSMGLNVNVDATAAGEAARSADGDQYASTDSPTAQRYTANKVDINSSSNMASSGALNQVLQMNRQAAQECLSMTKSMMQEKQGAEFDKAFAGSQVGAHVGMLAKLKASQQHASPELASIIKESEQTVQQHLDHAKQLCQELESQQASNR